MDYPTNIQSISNLTTFNLLIILSFIEFYILLYFQESLSYYNETDPNQCPYTLFPTFSHFWIDITIICLAAMLCLAACFCFIMIIYCCCRSIDKCIARLQWFHHKRAFVSAKYDSNPDLTKDPSFRQSVPMSQLKAMNPNLNKQSHHQTSHATPITTPRMKRAGFSNPVAQVIPDQPMNRVVTNVDRFESTFGMPLRSDQKQKIQAILLDQIDMEDRYEQQQQQANIYDLPPANDTDDFDDSTFDESNDSVKTQVYREENPAFMPERQYQAQQHQPKPQQREMVPPLIASKAVPPNKPPKQTPVR